MTRRFWARNLRHPSLERKVSTLTKLFVHVARDSMQELDLLQAKQMLVVSPVIDSPSIS